MLAMDDAADLRHQRKREVARFNAIAEDIIGREHESRLQRALHTEDGVICPFASYSASEYDLFGYRLLLEGHTQALPVQGDNALLMVTRTPLRMRLETFDVMTADDGGRDVDLWMDPKVMPDALTARLWHLLASRVMESCRFRVVTVLGTEGKVPWDGDGYIITDKYRRVDVTVVMTISHLNYFLSISMALPEEWATQPTEATMSNWTRVLAHNVGVAFGRLFPPATFGMIPVAIAEGASSHIQTQLQKSLQEASTELALGTPPEMREARYSKKQRKALMPDLNTLMTSLTPTLRDPTRAISEIDHAGMEALVDGLDAFLKDESALAVPEAKRRNLSLGD